MNIAHWRRREGATDPLLQAAAAGGQRSRQHGVGRIARRQGLSGAGQRECAAAQLVQPGRAGEGTVELQCRAAADVQHHAVGGIAAQRHRARAGQPGQRLAAAKQLAAGSPPAPLVASLAAPALMPPWLCRRLPG